MCNEEFSINEIMNWFYRNVKDEKKKHLKTQFATSRKVLGMDIK